VFKHSVTRVRRRAYDWQHCGEDKETMPLCVSATTSPRAFDAGNKDGD